MSTKEEILDFIKNFQNEGTVKTFTEGCCYWFACILTGWAFMSADNNEYKIMYNQIDGHFACEINGNLFDVTGEIERTENWVPWVSWCLTEPVYRNVVIRDCILKKKEGNE